MWAKTDKLLAVLLVTLTSSGCFYSDKQMSNIWTASNAIKDSTILTQHNREKGRWKKQANQYVIKKEGFAYWAIPKGSKDQKSTQFALISLSGPYYAIETPGRSWTGKGKYQYAFCEIRPDGILRWGVEGNEPFMKSIVSNRSLQRRLGVSCSSSGTLGAGECRVDSVGDLKQILRLILGKGLTPTVFYEVQGQASRKPPTERSDRKAPERTPGDSERVPRSQVPRKMNP